MRLCPHVKTHKTIALTQMCVDAGISQLKCATIAELEMVSRCNASFGLLAMQPVGPVMRRLCSLATEYAQTEIATVVDNKKSLQQLASFTRKEGTRITVLIDIDNGMGRTGIRPGAACIELYRDLMQIDSLTPGGLHVYDGHIHDRDFVARERNVDIAMEPVLAMRQQMLNADMPVPRLIVGGTGSFPVHAQHDDRICSPGTPLLWDAGYTGMFPDLEFLPAAVLLTRVVSVLPENRVCVDLGYKAVASEMQPPRTQFLNVEVTRECSHSEQHLVIEVTPDVKLTVGDLLYALPRHICPTVARHPEMLVVEEGKIVDSWAITARDRKISI